MSRANRQRPALKPCDGCKAALVDKARHAFSLHARWVVLCGPCAQKVFSVVRRKQPKRRALP